MGLLKTGLKAVVAVKTADVIHERIIQRQDAQWASQGHPAPVQAVPAPPPSQVLAPPSADDVLDRLTRLGELRANGILTDAEFDTQKARILSA